MKEPISMEEHREIGEDLKQIRARLIKYSSRFCETCGATSKAYKRLDKTIQWLDKARSDAEDVMYRDHRCGHTELDIYYGEGNPGR